jgi:uncharacterized protein (TIGR03437 family)
MLSSTLLQLSRFHLPLRPLSILIAAYLSVSVPPAFADDWPMYLVDLSHSSFRPGETQINSQNVGQLQQLWRASVGETISSAVTVSNGFLYFGDWGGNFHSLNAVTGAAQWTQFLGIAPNPPDPTCEPQGIGVSSQPVVSGNTVYSGGGDSAVYAMDRGTGQILWRTPLADPASGSYLWSSLTIYQNALYIGIASLTDCPLVRGGLARIPLDDPSHPQIVYFTPDGTIGAGLWSTPAFDDQNNLIYVTTGNADQSVQDAQQGIWGSTMLALDAGTLAIQSYFFMPLTPSEDDADWGSSPTLFQSGGQPLVVANGKNGVMYVLHRPDLALVWSYRLARDCDSPTDGCGSISTPAFDGNVLVTGAGQYGAVGPLGNVYEFDPASQNLLWRYQATASVVAPVTLTPGLVFVSTLSGLVVLDAATGAEIWTDGGVNGGLYSQPVVSNGIVYATYFRGDVVAWSFTASIGGSPALAVSQNAVQFLDTVGGPAPAAQTVAVSSGASTTGFTVVSDSPWLTSDAPSGSTPAIVTVRADPSGLDPGVYTGNLKIAAPGTTVPVQATLVVNPALPTVSADEIVNAASDQSGLAPGSLFTVFASNLATGSTAANNGSNGGSNSGPWATAWNGISVKINGVAAPLALVSPAQINAQVPYEIAPGTAQLTIESSGAATGPVDLTIQPASPGIFVDGSGRAAATNQDGTQNSPGNPAQIGSFVSIYLTGQGLVNPQAVTGAPAPLDQLLNTVAQTTATIGGVPASVSFSGLAPGFVGLCQVNLQIPDLPAGDQQVILTIGGAASNPATITVTR